MRKREPSGEERELFETTLKDVKPLKGRKRPRIKPAKPDKAAAAAKAAPVPRMELPSVRLRKGPSGLDGRTADRLRRGQLEPQARLDLHGLTEASAHRALLVFMKGAQARGLKLVLVVTGKGVREDVADAPFGLDLARRPRGVLKTMTPRWLKERDLEHLVADVRHAHRRHGGEGALYVYLRKHVP